MSMFGSGDSSDSSFGSDALTKGVDVELQQFVMAEKQKAELNAQIHEFNEMCWDRCVDKPGAKLDGRSESCLANCVDRFIDVSLMVTNRFAQHLERSIGTD